MVDWTRLSGERLAELIRIIDRNKDICGAERVTRDAIESLGEFRTGMAVMALVGLLEHPDEGHRETARVSLLRIRNSMGAVWLHGSLTVIYDDALERGDRRIRRNALRGMTYCANPGSAHEKLMRELRGKDRDDLEFAVRLAASAPHCEVAARLCWLACHDFGAPERLKMLAAESLAQMMRGLDRRSLMMTLPVISASTVSLLRRHHNDSDLDFMLSRMAEVLRSAAERIDDIAHDIDAH